MANCEICNNKIGVFDGSYLYKAENRNYKVCEKCYSLSEKIQNRNNLLDDEYVEIVNYFNDIISKDSIHDIGLKNLIEHLISASESVVSNTQRIKDIRENFILTTSYNVEGYLIAKYNRIVSGEIVLGTGFLSEMGSQISDIFGSTSNTFSNKMRQAKKMAQDKMMEEAIEIGANAIIGVDFDVMTIANNMIAVSANGTAVTIEKIKE